ncbi:unnamed protein product [Paramecium sonneborni]|uniref:Uncharacterized protein n=1 Tax=Paramecium sonneborni TaxID=65129 RepID=A0A8S1JYB2_9CILI|nr:unnamed protein product [Paramecium sonneborni]
MNYLFGGKDLKQQQGRSDQPHTINFNFVVNLQQGNLNLQLSIDPEIPFNISIEPECPFNRFVNGIKEVIFAQRMQAQYEETIEWQLGNGSTLQQNDQRTLEQLGFTNNCTLYVRLKLKGPPRIGICWSYQQEQRITNQNFNPEMSFALFVNFILLKERFDIQIPKEFINNIECELKQGVIIKQNETKSLKDLGFKHNCTLNIKLINRKDQKQILQQKIILNVLVDLQFQKIELNVSQYKSTPISCVFHDILMELFSKLQFKVTQPFAFFINDQEIDPYDCGLLEDFEQIQSINLKMIPSNKQSNQLLNEKYEFALKNKSKWYKFKLENIIKIECIENYVTFRAFINTSLEDITKQIISSHFQLIHYGVYLPQQKYYINGVQLQDINSIYSKADIIVQVEKQYRHQASQLTLIFLSNFIFKALFLLLKNSLKIIERIRFLLQKNEFQTFFLFVSIKILSNQFIFIASSSKIIQQSVLQESNYYNLFNS